MQPTEMNTQETAPVPPYGGGTHRKLKVFLIILIIVLVASGVAAGVLLTNKTATDQESESSNPSALVVISADSVTPASIQVKKGQSVVWTNEDVVPHMLVLNNEGERVQNADSPEQLNQDESYSYVFSEAGTFNYYDATNPGRLKGVVVVE